MKKAVKKADEQFISPYFPGGIVSISNLEKIVNTLKDFPDSKIKLSGGLIIGIKDPEQRKDFRQRLDLPLSSVAKFCIRPIHICSGGYICPNNQQDIYSLGLKLDQLYQGMELPFKMIISVAGCGRCCSEPKVRDIGIVAQRTGFSIYVGGAAGAKPRIGQLLIWDIEPEEVIGAIDSIIDTYRNCGKPGKRLGVVIEEMGFDVFKNSVNAGKNKT